MPIRILLEAAERITTLRTDVCVIGAGVAGLVAAVRLARSATTRVVLLESGIRHDDPMMMALDCIENASTNYRGAGRSRGLGGTSVKWAGKLLPLTRDDTLERQYLNAPAWPIDIGDLARYTSEIEAMMGVDSTSYEDDAASLLDTRGLLPHADDDFALRWPKRPTPANRNLARVLRDDLQRRANLELWLGATVSSFRFHRDTGKVAAVEGVDHGARRLVVEADEFLIAAGTHESTRLMLLADRNSGGVVSSVTDTLGRHFNDHLGLDVAVLRPIDRPGTNRTLADRWPLGTERHLHFELRPKVQRELGIASTYFDLGLLMPPASSLSLAREALNSARRRRFGRAISASAGVLRDVPALLQTARWSAIDRQKFWPPDGIATIRIWIEQLPHWRNRIVLSDKIDALGQPLLRVDYQRTNHEEQALRATRERLRAFWARHLAPICALDWIEPTPARGASLAAAATEMAHPAGATRMGTSPATSVVDPWLRVHCIPNLSIAGASVFPTSGSANPTFTIMQIAMRAADAIGSRLARR